MITTIRSALQQLEDGSTTSVRLVEDAILQADRHDERLGVYLDRYDESARRTAQDVDDRRARGERLGPLAGIPIGVKDIITTREGPTTAQSLVFDSASMSGDATVVSRLRAADAVIMGKTSTMEFAIGTPDVEKPFPIPRNPWNPDRWAGGSSSGTGAGVAADMFLGGLGTDTGGSIRMPAAFCGITGMKPTFGRVPKDGCAPLGFSLDHIGPMARSAWDCALMLNVMAGASNLDHSSSVHPVSDYLATDATDLRGVRVGVDRLERKYRDFSAASELASAFDQLEATLREAGATVVPIVLPLYDEVVTAATALMLVEGFAYHRNDLRDRWLDYSRGLRDALGMAAMYTSSDIVQAQRMRRVGMKQVANVFDEVDIIASPACSMGAVSFEQLEYWWDGYNAGVLTGYWNGCGNPSMSVPAGWTDDGMPLGIEIAGRPFDEAAVFRVGRAFQDRTNHHLATALGDEVRNER